MKTRQRLRFRRKKPVTAIARFAGLAGAPVLHGRLDPKRTEGLAIQKVGVRDRDEDILEWARIPGPCEVCLEHGPRCGHHVSSKGAGGHDSIDNLCRVCPACHDKIHRGLISRERLRAIIVERDRTGIV